MEAICKYREEVTANERQCTRIGKGSEFFPLLAQIRDNWRFINIFKEFTMSEKEKITPRLVFKDEQIEKFKSLFPETFADGKIDFDALKHALGEFIEDDSVEHFGLTWPGKRDARKMAFIPPKGTLKLAAGEGINEDTTQNLYIEGDNLEVLKLLQKSYYNKIKMIYIDPPYNTGNDFVYKDDFSQTIEDYLKETGQLSEEGKALSTNPKTSGRFHSNWLNMIYPRLVLAKTLLRDDGVIFVSIDDHEVHNLRAVMNEIFGEENFVAQLVWSNKEGGGSSDSNYFRIKHEYILCFARSLENLSINGVDIGNRDRYKQSDEFINIRGPYYLQKLGMGSIQYSLSLDYEITTPDGSKVSPKDNNNGKKACWRWSKSKFEWGIENNYIVISKDSKNIWTVYTKQYLNCDNEGNIIERTQRPFGVIDEFSSTQASKYLDKIGLSEVFNYSKPSELIKYLISLCVSSNSSEMILDYFSGSSTTAQSVIELNNEDGGNRNFIMVQLPEVLDPKNSKQKSAYEFCLNNKFNTNITEIGKERIRRVIKKIQEETAAPKEKPAKKKKQDEKLFEENVSDESKTDTAVDISKLDLGFKVLKLSESNIIKWPKTAFESIEQIEKQLEFSTESPLVSGYKKEDLLIEILIWEGFSLTSDISKVSIGKNTFYKVNDPSIEYALWACFDDKLDFSMNDIKGAGFTVREAHSVGEKQETKSSNDDILVFLDKSLTDGLKSRLCDICRVKVV